ncbi:TonB-dependent receptor domain-containing protein [Phenylobacterium sp. VNQ135]|uniref:TonB-dependent receptor domain-containing protein n=1 Tax=Phenylobacterium sp. VNQ135 TaxID=3400922 RepID=UPI003C0B8A0D
MLHASKALLCATTSMSLLWCGGAVAQTAEPAEVEQVVVTGSRIARQDYQAESPIVTVSAEAIQAAGPASVEQTLNTLPQFAATSGASSSNTALGGRANANLRGLGIARTLVLLDGRRMQPSDPLGAIDLNTISTALVRDVEVITGGASAVYGSDAIAGVVNFKLKHDFQGLELDAQYGETDRGDGQTLELAATLGGSFGEDRGNAVLSVAYLDRSHVERGSRPFFKDGGIAAVLPSGAIIPDAGNLPSAAAINAVFRGYGVTGTVPTNSRYSVNPDGTLFTTTTPIVNFRWPDSEPYIIINGQVGNPTGEFSPLQQPLERMVVFSRADYQLTDDIQAYGQFNYTHYTANVQRFGVNSATVRDVYLPVTNPFLPADLRTIIASRPRPNEPLLIYFNQGRFVREAYEQTYNVGQVLGGLTGKLPALEGSWDVYASYGRTEQNQTRSGYVDRAAYLSLVNAPDGGVSICEGGLNPLALAPPSAACLKYLVRDIHETSTFEQTVVEGTAQGRLFALPAGDVRFAAGASYRKNSYDFNPDAQRVSASVLGVALTNPTQGSVTAKELFAELLVPVVRDLPLVQSLELDLAYRYSHYDTVGGVHTYKASGDWEITDWLRARGGYQRAIRAPAVGELFQPSEQASATVGRTAAGQGDPCDITSVYRTGANAAQIRALCIANGVPATVIDNHRFTGSAVSAFVSGNRDLTEEVADTYTAGLVFRPGDLPFIHGLQASADYYSVSIRDAIGLITGDVIVRRCFNGDGSNPTYDPNNYYCGLINRSTSGAFATLTTPLLNLAGYKTSGIDFQLDATTRAEDFGLDERFGELSVNFVLSWMDTYKIQSLAGAAYFDYAGTIGNAQISADAISHPEWKVSSTFTYRVGDARLALRWRWIDAMGNSGNVGAAAATAPGVKSRSYFDLNGRYRLRENIEFRAGVLNLADTQPPEWTGEGATDFAIYDVLGRRYYAGVNIKF